jgi:hypothetical protein
MSITCLSRSNREHTSTVIAGARRTRLTSLRYWRGEVPHRLLRWLNRRRAGPPWVPVTEYQLCPQCLWKLDGAPISPTRRWRWQLGQGLNPQSRRANAWQLWMCSRAAGALVQGICIEPHKLGCVTVPTYDLACGAEGYGSRGGVVGARRQRQQYPKKQTTLPHRMELTLCATRRRGAGHVVPLLRETEKQGDLRRLRRLPLATSR